MKQNTALGSATAAIGEVSEQINYLDMAVADLESKLARVEEVFGPVLKASQACIGRPDEAELGSPMAVAIRSLRYRVEKCGDVCGDLLIRCAL